MRNKSGPGQHWISAGSRFHQCIVAGTRICYTSLTMEAPANQVTANQVTAIPGTAPLLRKHMPELDVFRGIAITLVLLYHFFYWTSHNQPNALANLFTHLTLFGWLGVNLFFVLSGFLITGILLDTKERPGYFRNFYLRRVRRIIPAYSLCILLLIVFGMLSFGGLLRAISFTANYHLIPAKASYGPFWSLSVEEQFYLFWPLLALLCSRRIFTAICVGICLLDPVLRYLALLPGYHLGDVHAATYLIADNFAIGALGALFFRSSWGTKKNTLWLSSAFTLLAFALLAIGIPRGLLHRTNPFGAAFQVVPFYLLFAAAMFGSLALQHDLFSGRIAYPLRFMGDISYGLYLFQLIFFAIYDRIFPAKTYYGHFPAEVLRAFVCISVAIAFSWVSRWYYEDLFLRKRPKQIKSQAVHPPQLAGDTASSVDSE